MGGRRLPGALHKIAIGSHGPRHPLDDAALQPILEAVDQALRPADQDVGVRAELLVGPSQNVPEVGPRADGREHELRGGAGVKVLELDISGAIAAAPSPPYARCDRQGGGRFQSSRPSAAAQRAARSTKAAQATAHCISQKVPTSQGGESRCFKSMPQAVSQAKSIQR